LEHILSNFEAPITAFTEKDGLSLMSFFQATHTGAFTEGNRIWYEVWPRVYFPFPYHNPLVMTPDRLQHLWKKGALILRYLSEEGEVGFPSYIMMVSDKEYGMKNVKHRSQTRRGLDHCEVSPVSFETLLKTGMPLIADTLTRQERRCTGKIMRYWEDFFSNAGACPCIEAWGAFYRRELASYLVSINYGALAHVHMLFSRTDLLQYCPVNALTFVFTCEAIRRPNVNHVSYGVRSIKGDKDTLNRFKRSMGFLTVRARERVEIHPCLKGIFDAGLARALAVTSEKFRGQSEFLGYVHGLLFTYLNQEPGTGNP